MKQIKKIPNIHLQILLLIEYLNQIPTFRDITKFSAFLKTQNNQAVLKKKNSVLIVVV